MSAGLDELAGLLSDDEDVGGHDANPRHSIWSLEFSTSASNSNSKRPSARKQRRTVATPNGQCLPQSGLQESPPETTITRSGSRSSRSIWDARSDHRSNPSESIMGIHSAASFITTPPSSKSAEGELSSLYAKHERTFTRDTRFGIGGRLWGATALMPAADTGLSAPRLFRHTGPNVGSSERVRAVHDSQNEAGSSAPSTHSMISSLDHPPPAYEAPTTTNCMDKDEEGAWSDAESPLLVTPTHSRLSTFRAPIRKSGKRYRPRMKRYSQPSSPSFSSLSFSHSRYSSEVSRYSAVLPASSVPPTALSEVETDPGDFFSQPSIADNPPTMNFPGIMSSNDAEGSDGSENGEDGQRICQRLDAMSNMLRSLVIEGQAALASQIHVISSDELQLIEHQAAKRNSRHGKTRTSSAITMRDCTDNHPAGKHVWSRNVAV